MTTFFSELAWDAPYTVRQLRRAPGFSLTVLLTLALAIGATAAMTGVLRATLLNPLPYSHPDRLLEIGDRNLQGFKTNGLITVARAADLAAIEHDGHTVFSDFSFLYWNDGQLAFSGHEPIRASSAAVSGSFFKTIGMAPLMGRALTEADDVRNAPLVAVISRHLWMSAFSGDRAILGRSVRLGEQQATIVGVMPEAFNLPAGVDFWYPGQISAANFQGYRGDGSRFVRVFARLAPSETLGSATQEAGLLATQLAHAFPQSDGTWAFELTSLRSSLFGDYRHALLLLSAAVALVLLVAAVNIAGLQLSRNAVREPEFAVRSALGVSPLRLARQLLTESVLLVLAGSLAGVAVGAMLLQGFATQLPAALLRIEKPHIDTAVLLTACGIALAVGVLTGIVPAIQSTRASLRGVARSTAPTTRLFGKVFSAAQIALALVLLTLSMAVLHGLYALLHTPLGFTTARIQTCSVDLSWAMEFSKRDRVYRQIENALAALPGVDSVGAVTALPLGNFSLRRTFDIAGQPSTAQHDAVVAEGRAFSPGYLHTLQIPLLTGRTFTEQDTVPNAPAVVVVNKALAARYFAGRNAVGQRLLGGRAVTGNAGSSEIIGVIGDVRGTDGTLTSPPQPEVYDAGNAGWPHLQFAIRSSLPSAVLEQQVRRAVASLDASASVGPLTPLARSVDRSLQQPRWNAALLTAFAGLSLLLVVVGVYGLVAFQVAQRSRELAVRLALGATRRGVLGLVLAESARLLGLGLAVGAAGSWAAARLFAAGFGVVLGGDTHFAFLAVPTAAVLAAAVLGATLIPALRASSIDPMQALRTE